MNLEFQTGVSEQELQELGLATGDAWPEPCFALYNNRLVLRDGVPVAAVVTASDFGRTAAVGFDEIVAIEVLPRFRGQGLAREITRLLARDGVIRLNSPCPELLSTLSKVATLTELNGSIYEARFRS